MRHEKLMEAKISGRDSKAESATDNPNPNPVAAAESEPVPAMQLEGVDGMDADDAEALREALRLSVASDPDAGGASMEVVGKGAPDGSDSLTPVAIGDGLPEGFTGERRTASFSLSTRDC